MLSPAVLAQLFASAVLGAVTVATAVWGLPAAIGWSPEEAGRRQLERERRMLLVEAVLKVALACQLVALFLFVATADRLHPLFPGAMCAAGTLAASPWGYPTLAAKGAVFFLCGLWLTLQRTRQTGGPTEAAAGTVRVRLQHGFAVAAAAALVAENGLQLRYFTDLEPEILTSCCATLFSAEAGGLASDLAALPPGASRAAFFALLGLTLGTGLRSLVGRRSATPYAALAVALGLVSMAAVVSWVAPAYYQLPTHHCPFCLLSHHLGHVGYPLYLLLFGAVITGAGSGLVQSLAGLGDAPEARRLCGVSMAGFAFFALLAVWPWATTDFQMGGL
jgi:hypothetical protein